MRLIDDIVADVMREMGCDPSKPPRWIPQEYYSATGFKVRDGFICSYCGKRSWAKHKVCDWCESSMTNGGDTHE